MKIETFAYIDNTAEMINVNGCDVGNSFDSEKTQAICVDPQLWLGLYPLPLGQLNWFKYIKFVYET